ncbi:MAG: hypothetical protein HPY68_04775 [Candidatus Atribacteria bacterium]|nr:hypothetical protein [Candidatus Atribacteria bacterium]
MEAVKEKPVIFLDGSSLVYRAFYALPRLQTSQGRPTGATLGFLNMLLRLLDVYGPFSVVAAFDHPQKTFRHEMYKEYKAKRKPMPDEMKPQLEDIKELLSTMGFPVLEKAGFEGDDLIGSGVAQLRGRYPLIVVTADLDLLQLVDDEIVLLQPVKGVTQLKKIDAETLSAEWGILPHQVVDVFALAGDPSDNIQGVPGVGEKTALKLIREFGSWENIRARESDLPSRLVAVLREYRDRIEENRKLLTIKTDALEKKLEITEWNWHKVSWEKLLQRLKDLELKALNERIQKRAKTPSSQEGAPWLFEREDSSIDAGHGKTPERRVSFLFPDLNKGKLSFEESLLEQDDVWCAPTLLFLVYPFLHLEEPSVFKCGEKDAADCEFLYPYLWKSREWLLEHPELLSMYREVEKALLKIWCVERRRVQGFALYPSVEYQSPFYEDLPLFRGNGDVILSFGDPALWEFLKAESVRREYRSEKDPSCFRTIYGWRFLSGRPIKEDELNKRFQSVLFEELRRLSIFILSVEMNVDTILEGNCLIAYLRGQDCSFLENFRNRLSSFLPSGWNLALQRTKDSGCYVVLLSGEGGGDGIGSPSGCF